MLWWRRGSAPPRRCTAAAYCSSEEEGPNAEISIAALCWVYVTNKVPASLSKWLAASSRSRHIALLTLLLSITIFSFMPRLFYQLTPARLHTLPNTSLSRPGQRSEARFLWAPPVPHLYLLPANYTGLNKVPSSVQRCTLWVIRNIKSWAEIKVGSDDVLNAAMDLQPWSFESDAPSVDKSGSLQRCFQQSASPLRRRLNGLAGVQ